MNTEQHNGTAHSTASSSSHVHGPWCSHEHGTQASAKVEKMKYLSTKDIPAYDVVETFKTNEGPNWEPNLRKATEQIWNRLKQVPEGEVLVLFCNVEFYKKFCLHVRRQIIATGNNQMLESGVMGMFGPKCVIVCDAPVGLDLTDLRAFYFCKEVLKPVPQPETGE